MKKLLLATAFVATSAVMTAPANSATLVVDGGWAEFSFGDVGSSWSDTFDFTLTGSAELQVTDAFLSGDQFEVFINAISQGLTSVPTSVGDSTSSYDTAFADPRWSSGSYILGPGSYTVSGTTILSPFSSGRAAIQLVSHDAAVPEPGTWLMMLLGFGTMGLAIRSRKRKLRMLQFA